MKEEKRNMKTSNIFWIIVIAIIILVVGAAAGSSGGSRSSGTTDRDVKYTFTITVAPQSSIRLTEIVYFNQYTEQSFHIFRDMLPYTFKFAKNDVLQFTVVPTSNYELNGWILADGDNRSDNPMLLKPDGDFSIELWLMPIGTATP